MSTGGEQSEPILSSGGEDEIDFPSILKALTSAQPHIRLPHRTRESFRSLDRSLKAFLHASNLPGLEYRLRIAGYHKLSDLYDADVNSLCAHGFTQLMAARLLRALNDYILKQMDKSEGLRLPFQMVRKGQKIKSDPTEKMKALPTFGKRNVKRQQRSEGSKPVKHPKKTVTSSKGGKVTTQKRSMPFLRLMSEENLPSEPIFPHTVPETREGELAFDEDGVFSSAPDDQRAISPFDIGAAPDDQRAISPSDVEAAPSEGLAAELVTMGGNETGDPLPERQHLQVPVVSRKDNRRSLPAFQEFYLPEEVDAGQFFNFEKTQWKLRRSNSIPADYQFYNSSSSSSPSSLSPPPHRFYPWDLKVRSYSCPPSLTTPPSQIESILAKLSSSQEIPVLLPSLRELCSLLSASMEAREEVLEKGGIEAIMDLLLFLCTNPQAVEYCLKVIKYLTREAALEDVMPPDMVSAVLQGMDCHPTNYNILSQGCLALGNIGRAAPSQCKQLLAGRGALTLAQVLEFFPSNPVVQVCGISALAVGLGCWPEGRLHLISEYGQVLDLVLLAMKNFASDPQVQEYACSFMALLIAEVAVEMESGVVQLIVEHVCIAMATHRHNSAVTVWASKVLANSSSNAALGDLKLAGRCCDVLAESLANFPANAQVWTWASYALLQLLSTNGGVRDELVRGGLVSVLKCPPSGLPAQADQYVEHLLTILLPTPVTFDP